MTSAAAAAPIPMRFQCGEAARESASTPPTAVAAAATVSVARRPRRGTRTNPPRNAPATVPTVFQTVTRPTPRPIPGRSAIAATAAGNAIPERIARGSRMGADSRICSRCVKPNESRTAGKPRMNAAGMCGTAAMPASAAKVLARSARPSTRAGGVRRIRENRALPSAIPPRNSRRISPNA